MSKLRIIFNLNVICLGHIVLGLGFNSVVYIICFNALKTSLIKTKSIFHFWKPG